MGNIGLKTNANAGTASGCSAANSCPNGTVCWNCECQPICSLNTPCPAGTTCQTVTDQFSTATACLPPPQIPLAPGISEQYQNFLANYPAVLVNWFVTNFKNIDLSQFGAPAPDTNGCANAQPVIPCPTTRGPLSNLNINAEATGSVSPPLIPTIHWASETITGIDSGTATIYPAPQASVQQQPYGAISNVTTSFWNYDTGALGINTVVAFTIPNATIYLASDYDPCAAPQLNLSLQLLVPLTILFIPGLSIPFSVNIAPSLIVPNIQSLQVNIPNITFTCNSDDPVAQAISTAINNGLIFSITADIRNALAPVLTNLLQNTLFGKYNSIAQSFLQQYHVLSPSNDVLITNPQQLVTLYLQYLQSQGTSPIVLAILNALVQQGIAKLEVILNWPVTSFSCLVTTLPAQSGCVTYISGHVQTYVGTSTTTSNKSKLKLSGKHPKPLQRPLKTVLSSKPSTSANRMNQKLDSRVYIDSTLQSKIYPTRSSAMGYCASKNNIQLFQCSAQGYGCIPYSGAAANAQFVMDPTNPAAGDAVMLQCTQQCIGRACGVSSFQCNTVDQCAFTQQQSELTGLELCDKTTLSDSNTCNSKCPSYILMANGSCVPAIGGQFYNDPNCGLPPTTQGACVIEEETSLCYDTFPSPALDTPAQGSPMTASSCAALTQFTGIAAKFYPNKKCSSQSCATGPTLCTDSKASCIPAPAVPNSNGTVFYQNWLPASCPPPPCNNQTNPCPNGLACVTTANGPVCQACQQNSDCPPTPAGAPQVCQSGTCVPAPTPPNATGSCFGSSFGAQFCYTGFPLPNDSTYNQGTPMTAESCSYLGQIISGNTTSSLQFTPGGTCNSQCSTTSGQCTANSTAGQLCLAFPTSATTWTAAGCR